LTTGNWGEWGTTQQGVNTACGNYTKNYFLEITIDGDIQTPRRRLLFPNYVLKNSSATFWNITANNICYSNQTGCNTTNIALTNQTNNFTATQNINGSLNVKNTTGTINLFEVNNTSNNVTIISDNGRQFTVQDSAGHIYFRTGSSANTFGYAGPVTINAGNAFLTLAGDTGVGFNTLNIERMRINAEKVEFKNSSGNVKSFINTSTGAIYFNETGSASSPLLQFGKAFTGTGWYDNGYGASFSIGGSNAFTMSGDTGFVASAGQGTFKVSDGTRSFAFRPDVGNFASIRQGRYASTTSNGLNIYSYALDAQPQVTNYSRLKINATNNFPIYFASEANGTGNRTSLLLNFTNVTAVSNIDSYAFSVNGTNGLTTNKLINGSTSQCWLNYTSGLLTSSDC